MRYLLLILILSGCSLHTHTYQIQDNGSYVTKLYFKKKCKFVEPQVTEKERVRQNTEKMDLPWNGTGWIYTAPIDAWPVGVMPKLHMETTEYNLIER